MAQVIKAGEKGGEVSALQGKLGQLGLSVQADGIFGPATKAAVEEIQAVFGYNIDGMVGPATEKLIESQVAGGFRVDKPDSIKQGLEAQGKKTDKGALAGAELTQVLKKGSEGGQVRYLQRRLSSLGYSLSIDGKFGADTEQSVKKLQTAFGYDVDGMVGEATHKLINAQIGYGWNVSKAAANKPQA
jgi:peptidoglycan hydrolase-like protein with peptidoglycan-binding domain